MTMSGLVVVAMLLASTAAAETGQGACTCVRTLAGSDSARTVLCDGYNAETHQTCACEKVPMNGQIGCTPKLETGVSGASDDDQPRVASPTDGATRGAD